MVVVAGLDPEEEVPILYLRLRKAWRQTPREDRGGRPLRRQLPRDRLALGPHRPRPRGRRAAARRHRPTRTSRAALGNPGDAVVLAGERLAQSPGALTAAARAGQQVGAQLRLGPPPPQRARRGRGRPRPGAAARRPCHGRPGPCEHGTGCRSAEGKDTRGMLEAAAAGEIKALHLIGVDPARDFEDPRLARAALEKVELLIVAGPHAERETVRYADVVLPAMRAPGAHRLASRPGRGAASRWPQSVAPPGPAAAGLGHPRRAGPRARRRPAAGRPRRRAPRGRPAADARRPHHRAPRRCRRRRRSAARAAPRWQPARRRPALPAGPRDPAHRCQGSCWRPRGPRPRGCTPTTRRRPASCTARHVTVRRPRRRARAAREGHRRSSSPAAS